MNFIEGVAAIILAILFFAWLSAALRGQGTAWLQSKFLGVSSTTSTTSSSVTAPTTVPA